MAREQEERSPKLEERKSVCGREGDHEAYRASKGQMGRRQLKGQGEAKLYKTL